MTYVVGTGSPNLLHLDDLFVGRRFRSGSHAISAGEVTTFGRQFDPQPFHLSDESGELSSAAWPPAAGSARRSCADLENEAGSLSPSGGLDRNTNPKRSERCESD